MKCDVSTEANAIEFLHPPEGNSYLIKAKFTSGEAREFNGFISLIR